MSILIAPAPNRTRLRPQQRKLTRNFEYAIKPKDAVEDQLVREARTDDGSGFLYAITNPAWPGWVKIGMTIDLDARLAVYETYAPLRDYAVLHSMQVADRHISEGFAHRKAADASGGVDPSGEWFYISDATGISILDKIR